MRKTKENQEEANKTFRIRPNEVASAQNIFSLEKYEDPPRKN